MASSFVKVRTDDENGNIFDIVWLSDKKNEEENKLRNSRNSITTFCNVDQCLKYIRQTSQQNQTILVVNHRLGQEILPYVHDISHIVLILIHCSTTDKDQQWANQYKKVIYYQILFRFFLKTFIYQY